MTGRSGRRRGSEGSGFFIRVRLPSLSFISSMMGVTLDLMLVLSRGLQSHITVTASVAQPTHLCQRGHVLPPCGLGQTSSHWPPPQVLMPQTK